MAIARGRAFEAEAGVGAADVGLQRQKTIVELLRNSTWSPQRLSTFVKELVTSGILTPDVCAEVTALFCDKGLPLPGGWPASTSFNSIAINPNSPAERAHNVGLTDAIKSEASSKKESRFEQEFERLELLGSGGFGQVWRVRSLVDQQEYAIKVVPYDFDETDGFLEHKALREARTWSTIRHPNIARYHTAWVEVDKESSGTVMELVGTDDIASCKVLFPPETSKSFSGFEDHNRRCENFGQINSSTAISWNTDVSECGVVFERSVSHEQNLQEVQLVPQHVTKVIKPCKQRATLYVQMELVRGGTLLEWMARRNTAFASGKITSEDARSWTQHAEKIFKECVSAIDHIHSKSIIHRDIKPSNVVLTEDGSVRLCDFGIATFSGNPANGHSGAVMRSIEQGICLETSQHTQGVGTPSYASPEQIAGKEYCTQVDMYSLGLILAELLHPVQTNMERVVLLEGLRDRKFLASPGEDRQSQGATDLALLLTNPEPSERPTSADLSSFLAGAPVAAATSCSQSNFLSGKYFVTAPDHAQLCLSCS